MKEQIDQVRAQFLQDFQQLSDARAVEQFRIKFLGKNGLVTGLFKQLGQVDKAERPAVGKMLNELRREVEELIRQSKEQFGAAKKESTIDLTLPGRQPAYGGKHPLSVVREEAKQIFAKLGFTVADGPEVETDYYNFEALNIPRLHPARNMQDTLYITEDLVLRTHTSPVQIRTMLRQKPPVRIIAPGRVYRRDTPDASHSPVFHQVEGLCVDEGVSMADLKAVLSVFVREMFGKEFKVRFRPSYFPFTEPSAEMDLWWESSRGGRWLELLGCGMVHPNVLSEVGIDPEKYTGWAFGVGIDRLAMLKYAIDDIRLFFENDMRFLEQFS